MNLKKLTQAVFEGLPSKYRWAAVDWDGETYAHAVKPECHFYSGRWVQPIIRGSLALFGGDHDATDWQNSLIERQDVPTADKPESIHDVARSIEAARVAEQKFKVKPCPHGCVSATIEQACMPWPDGDPRYFETSDVVNNPSHYTTGGIECIDAMQAMLSRDEFIGYLRGNIFKYQWRYKHKNGVEDLRKADWYAQRLIKVEGEK